MSADSLTKPIYPMAYSTGVALAPPDFRRLFESAPGLYLILTPDLEIAAVSEAYLAATMTRREDIIGRNLFDVFPDNPDDPAATGASNLRASLDRVRRDRVADTMAVQKYDIRRPAAEGGGFEERFWSPVNSPVFGPHGDLLYINHRVQDVTEFVRLTQRGHEQARKASQMEAEVFLRAQDIAAANRELSRLNEELEAFSYSVSHDLRAPLRGIAGFSQALTEDYADRLDDKGRDYLNRIRSGAQRMANLIDDLLQLSRVGRAEMRHEPVDLSALARAIIADLERAEPSRRVRVDVPDGLSIVGDPTLLRVLLDNLLRNAWKFTAPVPAAEIVLGQDAHEGETTYFVRDTGVGFDPAYVDRLFSPFQRLHRETDFPGTGIGLATVRRIVSRHGGRSWAEGAVGAGAKISWTIGVVASRERA